MKSRFTQLKNFFWKRPLGECDTCPDLAAAPAGKRKLAFFRTDPFKKSTWFVVSTLVAKRNAHSSAPMAKRFNQAAAALKPSLPFALVRDGTTGFAAGTPAS